MINEYPIIRGSYLPGLRFLLRDKADQPVDLTGMTSARLVAAERYQTAEAKLLVNKALEGAGALTEGVLVGTWLSSETNIKAGSYKSQIEVVFNDDPEQTGKFGPVTFVVTDSVT